MCDTPVRMGCRAGPRLTVAAAALALLCAAPIIIQADIVRTKDGRVLSGRIVAKTGTLVMLKLDDGRSITVSTLDIETIEEDSSTTPVKPVKPPVRPTPKPVTPKPDSADSGDLLVPVKAIAWTHAKGQVVRDSAAQSKQVWTSQRLKRRRQPLLKSGIAKLTKGVYQVTLRMKASQTWDEPVLDLALDSQGDCYGKAFLTHWADEKPAYRDVDLFLTTENVRDATLTIWWAGHTDVWLDTIKMRRVPRLPASVSLVYRRTGRFGGPPAFKVAGEYQFKHLRSGDAELKVRLRSAYKNIEVVVESLQVRITFAGDELKEFTVPGIRKPARYDSFIGFTHQFRLGRRKAEHISIEPRCKSRELR